MSEYGRRLIVDYPFDRALWSVIDGFVREGFTVKAIDVRGLVRVGAKAADLGVVR